MGHQTYRCDGDVYRDDKKIIVLANKKCIELPAALKYEIETSGIDKKVLM